MKSGGRNSTPSLATYAQCALVFILVGVRCTWCRGQRQLQWMVRSLRPLPRINPSERESWKLCLRSASFHQVSKMGQGSPRGLFPRKKETSPFDVNKSTFDLTSKNAIHRVEDVIHRSACQIKADDRLTISEFNFPSLLSFPSFRSQD